MKDAYQLGREARDRLSDFTLNPFWRNSKNHHDWGDGWLDREFELFDQSGLTEIQWRRLMGVKIKK